MSIRQFKFDAIRVANPDIKPTSNPHALAICEPPNSFRHEEEIAFNFSEFRIDTVFYFGATNIKRTADFRRVETQVACSRKRMIVAKFSQNTGPANFGSLTHQTI